MRKREIITTARRKAIDRIVSRILVFALCITLVPFTLATDANAFEEDTIVAQKALASVNAGYTPTNLVNGKFEYHPELYPNDLIEVWEHRNSPRKFNVETEVGIVTNLVNHVNGHQNVFEPIQDNWKTTETRRWQYASASSSLFEWLNTNRPAVVTTYGISNSDGYFVEMNADGMNVLYQDLNTQYNDIILWKLDHAARMNNIAPANKVQSLQVDIGAANGQPVNTDAKINENNGTAAFYKYVNGQETVTSKHDGSESSKYGYIVKDSNLAGLTIDANDGIQRNVWQTVKGVYIVPENQPVTRFGFTSISGGTTGNFLDNVVFETLLGNVKIFPDQENDPDNIKVTGYWALVDENEGASVEYEIYKVNENGDPIGSSVVNGDIDMSKLAQDPATPDWSALIPKDGLEPGDYIIKVNHSDYPEAKTSAPFTMNPDVIYDANGGSKTVDGETVTRVGDYDVELHASYKVRGNDYTGFKKTGYTFKGWANDPNATTPDYFPGATIDAEDNKTLYAVWEANIYTVTYHNLVKPEYYTESESSLVAAGTDLNETGRGSSYRYGDTVPLKDIDDTDYTAFTAPSCYNIEHTHTCTFVGWDTVSPADRLAAHQSPQIVYSKEASFLMPDDDVDLYAVWVAPDHITVLYHKVAAGAELIDIDNSPNTIFEKENGSVVVVNGADYFTYEKHKFVAWHEDAPDANGVFPNTPGHVHDKYGDDPDAHKITKACDTNDDGLVNLYAEWQQLYQITYHDNFYVNENGPQNDHDVKQYIDPGYYLGTEAADVMSAADAKTNLPKGDHVLLGWTNVKADAFEANKTIWNDPDKVNDPDTIAKIKYSADDTNISSKVNVTGDLDLYAIWQPAYHLAYHANGGDEPNGPKPEVTGLVMGATPTVDENLSTGTHPYTRTGYTFAGWENKKNGVVYKVGTDNSKVPVNNDTLSAYDSNHKHAIRHVDLYAKWEPITYKVTYVDLHDASSVVPVDNTNYTVFDLVHVSQNTLPNNADYKFLGWSTDPDSEVPMTDPFYIGEDTTLYAIWKPLHGVAYSDNCPEGATHTGHTPEDNSHAVGDVISASENGFVIPGYTFIEWNTTADGTGQSYKPGDTVTVPDGGMILYAQWKKSPIVTFDSQCDVIAPDAQQVDYNTPAKDPGAIYRPHYSFTGWYKDAACTTPFDFTQKITEDVTVYAGWNYVGGTTTKTDNTLTYESNGGTKYPTETYPNGTVVDLNKVPAKEGYIFTGWYSDAALTNKITDVTMNGSKTVYAGWKAATVPGMLNDYDHFAYVIGYPDGMVQPNGQITRAEIATIFFRLLKPEVRDGNLTTQNPFEDVKQGDWYNKPVSTMVKLGIVNGRTTTTFAPNAPITRAELATICARFDETVVDNGNLTFSDVANHWAYKEIGHAAALGWLMGYPDGTFLPDASITRAETMTLINRVLQRIPETESDLLPDMVKWPDNVSTQWYYLAVQEATNSHDFNHKGEIHETWTELTAVPDWTRYEN